MPNRVLHESLLDSRSLEVLSPRAQDAFPRFILLADDFGCFEVNPRVLWAKGWSRRPDVSEADVAGWIVEYAEKQAVDAETGDRLPPVLMLWTHAGRRYAHLTGWFGTHGQKRRAEYDPNAAAGTPGRHGSKRKTPRPPADLLAAVMSGDVRAIDGKPPGTDREPTGNEAPETVNDSTPARESAGRTAGGSRETAGSREFPAPAVPVPVADPGALLSTAVRSAPAPVDARLKPLLGDIEAAFLVARGSKYLHGGAKDTQALKRLLAANEPAEILRRWKASLAEDGFHRCDSIAQFATSTHWNHFSAGGASRPKVRILTAD
jgi:hypothetical protein